MLARGATHLLVLHVLHLAGGREPVAARHGVQRPAHVDVVLPPRTVLARAVHGEPVLRMAAFRDG